MRQDVTTTPTALSGLTVGTEYTLQSRAPGLVYVEAADAAPSASGAAFVLSPEAFLIVKRDASTQEIYVWGERSGGGVVFEEAP